MGTRGRKSSADLTVVGNNTTLERVERPQPPRELTIEQAAEWRVVVERLPADWFPCETHGMLIQYCRHIVTARRVDELIRNYEDRDNESFDVEEYDRLLKMQEREGRALSSLATRMRITQQTTYDKSKKKPKPGKRPWQ